MSKNEFLQHFDSIPALFPIQGEARAAIHNGLDFPTTRDEHWKYTRVASIVNGSYQRNAPAIQSIDEFRTEHSDFCYIVFVNGVYQPDRSSALPAGLTMEAMSVMKGEKRDDMLAELGQLIDHKMQPFQSLNTGYFEDGAYITVEKNAVIEQPICLINISSGKAQATNVRNLVHVGAGAQVSLIHRFEGKDNDGSFTNAVTEIHADENAQVSYYLIENEGTDTSLINATHIAQKRDSRFTIVTVTKSGQLVRNNINAAIQGEGCETNMYGIYFTSDRQHVDNHTYADHQQPHCNSNELYKGVMTDRSTGVFNGKIMVHRAAQQTNAFQSNQNVLLSDNATINTKPELEIYADDVKCSHGCTVGQLDEEALFYLQSRGLGKEAASQLLVRAFAGDVLEHVEIEAIREELEQFIDQKFEKLIL